MKKHTYIAPTAWAPYIINGDATVFDGLNADPVEADAELAKANKWLASITEAIGNANCVGMDDLGFLVRPAGILYVGDKEAEAGNFAEYHFLTP